MHIRFLTAFLLSVAVLAPPVAHAEAKPDVIGIRIGDVEAHVSDVLKAGEVPYQLSANTTKVALLQDARFTTDLRASANGLAAKEDLTMKFTPPPSGALYSIQRSVLYKEGSEPTLDAVRAALEDKYGEAPASEFGYLLWFWDTQGQRVAPPASLRCIRGNRTRVSPDMILVPNTTPQSIENRVGSFGVADAMPACGLFVKASLNMNPKNAGLVSSLNVTLVNAQFAVEAYTTAQKRVAAAYEAHQKNALDEAKTRAPPKL